MILMKEYVPWRTATMKKDIFTVITAMIAKRKKTLHWVIPC